MVTAAVGMVWGSSEEENNPPSSERWRRGLYRNGGARY